MAMIHPTVVFGPPNMADYKPGDAYHEPIIGEGVKIGAYSTIDGGWDVPTVIGDRVWLMQYCHVGHDCWLHADVVLAVGCKLAGYTHIGIRSKLGIGVITLPFVKIGADCQIGAGAVVTKDVPDGEQWVGNPARPLPRKTETTIARKFKNR